MIVSLIRGIVLGGVIATAAIAVLYFIAWSIWT